MFCRSLCFFCELTKGNMKIKCSERGSCIFCTFTSVQDDYNKFLQSGYGIKNFNCCNNVTEETMFNVSIDQVVVIPFLLY